MSAGTHDASARSAGYGFLLRQLVARDFKTRYKRSVLGVFWSLLNPLMTMGIQYVVFSALFSGQVADYPLYLLSGIVCFNFFTEAAGAALTSVTGNAALITRVHVPVEVYPVSRVLSAAVNLLFSLLPLLTAALLTAGLPGPSVLLLPLGLAFLALTALGVGLGLATMMVYFRDTQFLWGAVSMLWMYLTPVFYPVSILPEGLRRLLMLNPLYHVITFVRTLLLDGRVPGPGTWLGCAASAGLSMLLGGAVFTRHRDEFVMYL
ncbi:MAG: ABC transporter permease [Oscillospiraceae bacterium]|nr:ABC transporter permease [Oscillospiraceae bacterium]